jgi:hypothetical protein
MRVRTLFIFAWFTRATAATDWFISGMEIVEMNERQLNLPLDNAECGNERNAQNRQIPHSCVEVRVCGVP